MNMGDMAKSPFFQFLLLFFSLNPSISETIRSTSLWSTDLFSACAHVLRIAAHAGKGKV